MYGAEKWTYRCPFVQTNGGERNRHITDVVFEADAPLSKMAHRTNYSITEELNIPIGLSFICLKSFSDKESLGKETSWRG